MILRALLFALVGAMLLSLGCGTGTEVAHDCFVIGTSSTCCTTTCEDPETWEDCNTYCSTID